MKQKIAQIALLVKDYDHAIDFYTNKLNFELTEDTQLGPEKRWVTLIPPGAIETQLLLAKADSPDQEEVIGNQTGGRVFLFLSTDDFWRDYHAMLKKGVVFIEEPREEVYGTVCIFKDLYGTKWDLIQYK